MCLLLALLDTRIYMRRGAPVGAWARLGAVGVVVWAAFGPATSPAPKCSTSAKTHEIRAVPAQSSDQNGRNDDRHPPHVGRMDPLDNFNYNTQGFWALF